MTALSVGPVSTVTCPSWCTVSPSEHLAQLRWEGRTVHWSERRHGDGWQVRAGSVVDASGERPDAAAELHVTTSESLSPAAAEALALTLLGALEQTRD
jgi:hypothetical protein